eukprot:CAMPEP_0198199962 /NCGR_PEP_ID=MMETSP1445-20131203/3056_1 /TAXON_ID=36898 /ORGANISM="Pyramimonas sp., Strain CCMP2087" /LENGTH=319 /DNA_ID=CAMNT_0043869879 /DNA_START=36 /DNA_END=995 /DNA_ORIENTATION=+
MACSINHPTTWTESASKRHAVESARVLRKMHPCSAVLHRPSDTRVELTVARAARQNLRLASPIGMRAVRKGRSRVFSLSAAADGVEQLSARPLLSLQDTAVLPEDAIKQIQDVPGVYAVYDEKETVQYLGISRKVASSVVAHLEDLPELTFALRTLALPGGNKAELQGAWKAWMQECISTTGRVPPGNEPGERQWITRKKKPAKPEIELTDGTDSQHDMDALLKEAVANHPIVLFIKGSRTNPECSFSYNILQIFEEYKVDYETVNVMDERHNPGAREVLKTLSDWPTIPQVYMNGEFMGGAEIIEEMHKKGELKPMIR